MEIIGEIKSSSENVYDEEVIDKERFVNANLVATIKERYSFNEVSVPPSEKLKDKNIIFKGGKFVHDSSEFLIAELAVGTLGYRVSMWEETSIVKAVLDDFRKMIESVGAFPKLSRFTPDEKSITVFDAKLDIPTTNLLSQKFLKILKEFSTKFKKESFDTEIHTFSVGASYVFKPNLQELARKSLPEAELTKIFKETEVKSLIIEHLSVEKFHRGEVHIRSNLSSEMTKSLLEELERKLRSTP